MIKDLRVKSIKVLEDVLNTLNNETRENYGLCHLTDLSCDKFFINEDWYASQDEKECIIDIVMQILKLAGDITHPWIDKGTHWFWFPSWENSDRIHIVELALTKLKDKETLRMSKLFVLQDVLDVIRGGQYVMFRGKRIDNNSMCLAVEKMCKQRSMFNGRLIYTDVMNELACAALLLYPSIDTDEDSFWFNPKDKTSRVQVIREAIYTVHNQEYLTDDDDCKS